MEPTIHSHPELFSRMMNSINRQIKKHDIRLYGRPFKTNVGEAIPAINLIRIPAIYDIRSIYVSYHEIGHIIFGHYINPKRRPYLQEMEAEKYALQQLRRFSIHKLFPDIYAAIKEEAADYVIKFIMKEISKGVKCDEISTSAYEFIKPYINFPLLFKLFVLKKKKKSASGRKSK